MKKLAAKILKYLLTKVFKPKHEYHGKANKNIKTLQNGTYTMKTKIYKK